MDDRDFEAARRALACARREARAVAVLPAAWRPADLAEAYRLQGAVAADLGAVAGWKVGALTAEQRRTMGVPVAIGGALVNAFVRDAGAGPAVLRLAEFIAPKIECEFAFELGRDLPARPGAAYARDEVAAAVEALRIGIEIVDPRLPAGSGALAELADGFNNGAFVAGPRLRSWRHLDFAAVDIALTVEPASGPERALAGGNGRAILEGNPFAAVVMLANAPPDGARGLRAGDIVTTGSCSGAPPAPGPGLYRGAFAGIGNVELRFD